MEDKSKIITTFDAIAWGAFISLIGIGWLVSEVYQFSTISYIALGAGLVLIALNVARWRLRVGISKFGLFSGLIMTALSGPGIAGVAVPFIPLMIVLIGLFVVVEAVQRMTRKKPANTGLK